MSLRSILVMCVAVLCLLGYAVVLQSSRNRAILDRARKERLADGEWVRTTMRDNPLIRVWVVDCAKTRPLAECSDDAVDLWR